MCRSLPSLLSAFSLAIALVSVGAACTPVDRTASERPNILLIVADDMGYSDVGAYGGEIATPNIDALADVGVQFTQFHVAPNCGPTRGAMLSGVDYHVAGLGGNPEVAAENQRGQPGYEGHLSDRVVTMAELIRDAGYRTYMTGKWHLGRDERNLPSGRGFEQSFALINGGASHWADQGALIPGAATRYVQNGQTVAQLPPDFYSTMYYTDRMIDFIDRNAGDRTPFFAYLAYTAPHNPLHVPAEYVEKYRGTYDDGWDALAGRRVARLRELGLLADAHVAHPRPEWIMAWDELTSEQQAARTRDMEVYAGMIDYLDESIGRVLDHLREIGEYDNTLIVFISDNGPSRTTTLDYVALGGEAGEFFAQFDNSLDNRGLPNSSPDIGPGWAYASASPLRLFKGYVAQGGIQVPAIVKLPGQMPNGGTKNPAFTHVMDLMPTFLEVAGASYPESYSGNEIAPLQGKSLLPLLEGKSNAGFAERGLGWEAYGMDAFRRGDWKVLRLPEPYGAGSWQLYNLADDPGEVNDVAAEYPELVDELTQAWERYAKENGVIRPSEPVAYARPVSGRKY
jgi:arylsulfatase